MQQPEEYFQTENLQAEPEAMVQHNPQIGAELARLDDAMQTLHERTHHFAWLLQSGFCHAKAGSDKTILREQLQAIAHVIETLEAWGDELQDGETVPIRLCMALNEELSEWRSLFYKMPATACLTAQEPSLGADIANLGIEGETLGEMIEHLSGRASDPYDADAIRQRLHYLRERIEILAARPLEDELQSLWNSYWRTRQRRGDEDERQEHQVHVVWRRFGWDGAPAGTLQAASEVGLWPITRERARQIIAPFEKWLQSATPFAPVTQRAVHFVEEHLPAFAEDVEERLRDEGLTRGTFRLEALADVAHSLGLASHFTIAALTSDSESADTGHRLAWASQGESSSGLLAIVLKALRDHVWERGIGHLPALQMELEERHADAAELLHLVLDTLPEVRWLHRGEGWFWLTSSQAMRRQENRLITRVERILSVAQCLPMEKLYAALLRNHLHQQEMRTNPYEWEMASLDIFEEWCHQMPLYRIESDSIQMEQTPSPQEVLPPTELIMVEVLHEHGPALSRWKFEQFCAARGIAKPTFYIYVDGVGTIEEVAEGVYALMGANVSKQDIESAEAENRRINPRVLLDFGHSDDDKIWIRYQASEGMCVSGNCACPSQLRETLQGNFTLRDANDEPLGTFVFRGAAGWGLGPFLRRSGQPGDDILLVFDLAQRQVTLVHNGQGWPHMKIIGA